MFQSSDYRCDCVLWGEKTSETERDLRVDDETAIYSRMILWRTLPCPPTIVTFMVISKAIMKDSRTETDGTGDDVTRAGE